MVKAIVSYSGLELNFVLKPKSGISNAYATILNGKRYLFYDPDFLRELAEAENTDWVRLGILAHEVGHHLQGHTVTGDGSSPQIELEADGYAGFVMGLMGASAKEAAAYLNELDAEASATHPGRKERQIAVSKGWDKAQPLVVKRDGVQRGCPLIRLDVPSSRVTKGRMILASSAQGDLTLRWGHDDIVQGLWMVEGGARKITGSLGPDRVLRLELFEACKPLGNIHVTPASSTNPRLELWKGLFSPLEGPAREVGLTFPKD